MTGFDQKQTLIRRIVLGLALALFAGSLLLPAFAIKDADFTGFVVLIYGWIGIRMWFGWSWLANPVFLYTLFLFSHDTKRVRRAAVFTSAAALLLSLSFLFVDTIPGPKTEALAGAVTHRIGCWVWIGSMAAELAAAILFDRAVRRKQPE